jgi:hypothetical protein
MEMRSFMSSGDVSIQSVVLYSGSMDCLMGHTVGVPVTLALSLAAPAAISLASAVFHCASEPSAGPPVP